MPKIPTHGRRLAKPAKGGTARCWGLTGWLWALFVPVVMGCSDRDAGIGAPPAVRWAADAAVAPDGTVGFPEGGIGQQALSLVRVDPPQGPFTGGQRVTLRGTAFAEGLVVRFGDVLGAEVRIEDRNRASVRVPAGDPGSVDVTVELGGVSMTLAQGYRYEALQVMPEEGPVSGGTRVQIVSHAARFLDGTEVFFGSASCLDATVVSDTLITCRTPVAAPGVVDVRVVLPSGEQSTAVGAYTYYDAADALGGGLSGPPIDGTVNVTVYEAITGSPLPGAFVLLGEDLSSPYQKRTDARGQVSFDDVALVGPQHVHVALRCFETTSFIDFDARDVSIFLEPHLDLSCIDIDLSDLDNLPGGGGGGGGGQGVQGTVVQGELIFDGGSEFGPNRWEGVPEPRPGETRVAYVFASTPSVTSANPDPALGGGHRVLERIEAAGLRGFPYSIFVRPGAMAIYALAGVEDARGRFTPYLMGLARAVVAAPGQQLTGVDVPMRVELNQTLTTRFVDLPGAVVDGPDRVIVEAFLDLGGEGVIARRVGGQRVDTAFSKDPQAPVRIVGMPSLSGPLEDARVAMLAGWVKGPNESVPYTRQRVGGVEDLSEPVLLRDWVAIPEATTPVDGGLIAERHLEWSVKGQAPDYYYMSLTAKDGTPLWRFLVQGDATRVSLPDLSSLSFVDDLRRGDVQWRMVAIRAPGRDFNAFAPRHLQQRYWTHWASHSLRIVK